MSATWTCPMHPEVQSDQPGSCPKCGMALERADVPVRKTQYTCPMHPQIVRDHPGSCPIGGKEEKGEEERAKEEKREREEMKGSKWEREVMNMKK